MICVKFDLLWDSPEYTEVVERPDGTGYVKLKENVPEEIKKSWDHYGEQVEEIARREAKYPPGTHLW